MNKYIIFLLCIYAISGCSNSEQESEGTQSTQLSATQDLTELRECSAWFLVSSQVFGSYIKNNTGINPQTNEKMRIMLAEGAIALYQEIGKRTGKSPESVLAASTPLRDKYTKDYDDNSGDNWSKWVKASGKDDYCLSIYKSL